MESNVRNGVKYLLKVPMQHQDRLAAIYNWQHLFVGKEADVIWIHGFSSDEINQIEVKAIPGIQRYYTVNGKLFPLNHSLPIGNEPAMLWTPIQRAIQMDLPKKNHNYFGIAAKMKVSLIKSEVEKPAKVLRLSIDVLDKHLLSISALRMHPLKWIILGNEVLLYGTPMLPLPGNTYWIDEDFIIPTGFEINPPLMTKIINNKINTNKENYILWNQDGNYHLIAKTEFNQLSRSSFRATLSK